MTETDALWMQAARGGTVLASSRVDLDGTQWVEVVVERPHETVTVQAETIAAALRALIDPDRAGMLWQIQQRTPACPAWSPLPCSVAYHSRDMAETAAQSWADAQQDTVLVRLIGMVRR